MKIGFISPKWLPHHGGQQQYAHRLALAMQGLGVETPIFCSTPEAKDKDNGACEATRWSSPQLGSYDNWEPAFANAQINEGGVFWLYEFMEAAVQWAISQSLDAVLIGPPLTNPKFYPVRELTKQLKAHGIKVGTILHDLDSRTRATLVQEYRKSKDWDSAAQAVRKAISTIMQKTTALRAYQFIGSPLFFDPDLVITSSTWTSYFLDPLGTTPKFAMHPVLDVDYWSAPPPVADALPSKNILMINPIPHKGRLHMANLVRMADRDWTFRVLKGGYGDAFAGFVPMIADAVAVKQGRVTMDEYVQDMRTAYRATDVVFFPSLYEGYGMTAVEPMFAGTCVVSSNYPAVIEAVGNGAPTVCPHTGTPAQWRAAVSDVLQRKSFWRAAIKKRVGELAQRQDREITQLIDLIRTLQVR